jgi:hypothetical protein
MHCNPAMTIDNRKNRKNGNKEISPLTLIVVTLTICFVSNALTNMSFAGYVAFIAACSVIRECL